MNDTPASPNHLMLLPMPLSPGQIQKKADILKKKLEVQTQHDIIMEELRTICNWKKISHLPTRRLYRNYTLIYSPKELGEKIRLSMIDILGK